MKTTDGKAMATTIEANKRHLEWFFEGAEAPVEFLAREIAQAGYRNYSARMRAGKYSLRLSPIIRPGVESVVN